MTDDIRPNRYRMRAIVFKRDDGVCAICNKKDPKWQADHIIPIHQNGPDEESNWQTLCKEHHLEKSRREAIRRRKRSADIANIGDYYRPYRPYKSHLTKIERNQKIFELAEGHDYTYEEIGRMFDIGRERVRQIYKYTMLHQQPES